MPPSELRARVPHAVLADHTLWNRVASRVRTDMSVRVVPAGHDGTSLEEGWLYFAPMNGHGGEALRSPTSAFSPRTPASALSSALPMRVAYRSTPA